MSDRESREGLRCAVLDDVDSRKLKRTDGKKSADTRLEEEYKK